MKKRIMSKQDNGTAMFRFWLILGIMLSIVVGGTVFLKQVEAEELPRKFCVNFEDETLCGDQTYERLQLHVVIGLARPGDEILLAGGVYYPGDINFSDRNDHFTLKNGVTITGGYDGKETILTGNIGAWNSASDNAYNVIRNFNLDNTAILQNVTIEGGMADGVGAEFESNGGGIYNHNSSPTIRNVIIRHNTAKFGGGGIANVNSSPSLTNVVISGNNTTFNDGRGGGLHNSNSNPILTNVLISGNRADLSGGGIYNTSNSEPTLTNVTVSGNYSYFGGGMYSTINTNPIVRNSIFLGNSNSNPELYLEIEVGQEEEEEYLDEYSIIGKGNEPVNEYFVNPLPRPDHTFVATSAGDFRLKAGSAAINAGNSSYYDDEGKTPDLSGIRSDMHGIPRKLSRAVDLGAYEYDYLNITVAGGEVAGGGAFKYESLATVTASVYAGYTFVNWTEGGVEVSTDASYTFMLTDDTTLTANFEPIMHDITLTAVPVAGGTMSGVVSVQETHDTTVTANANGGYRFVNWTESGAEVSTDASFTFEVKGARTLVANFELLPYSVTYNGNDNDVGSIPTDNETYSLNDSVAVSDNTGSLGKTGYTFAGWNTKADGSDTSYAPGDAFSMGTNHVILYAEWVDRFAPATTILMNKADETPYTNDTWTNQSVTVSVYATDDGSGLASLEYSEDGGASWQPVDGVLTYSEEGVYTLFFKAIDEEGNEGQETSTVKINRNGLDVTMTASTESGDPYVPGTWTNQTVTADVYASHLQGVVVTSIAYSLDDGVIWIPYTDPLVISGTGTHTIRVNIQDEAGNELEDALTVKIDQTKSIIEFGTNGKETWSTRGSTFVSASDAESGLNPGSLAFAWSQSDTTPADSWATFANGAELTKSGVDGDWYLHIRAQDALGNTADAVSGRFRLDASAAELNGLALSAGTLDPAFDASIMVYQASVANNVSSIALTPVTLDATDIITVSINGGTPSTVTSGLASEPLALLTGANTIEIEVTALNGARNTYSIAVTRAASSPGTSGGSSVNPLEPGEKASWLVDSPVIVSLTIKKVIRPDGTVAEQVSLDEETLDEALNRLKDVGKPILTIQVDDSERVVQVQLPATSIAAAAESHTNGTIIEVELNGSSFQLVISVLNLAALAERLGVELKDMKVNIILERADEATETQIRELAGMEGFDLVSAVVDFKVTVEANGQAVEIRDFGGTYMARAIVMEEGAANRNLTGVLYDPETKTFTFVPSHSGTRTDGTPETVMNVPHNSMYAVLESKGRTFDDLSGHWAKADVELLASKLIVNGVGDGLFAPDVDITRAEFTALLVRSLGLSLNLGGQTSDFADVAANAWFKPAVEAAVKAGLASGMSPDRFAPNERITREQMSVMVARALSFAGKEAEVNREALAKFTDLTTISAWAIEAAAQAVAAGIIEGMPDGTFMPAEHATRAQSAAMLRRFLQFAEFID